MNPVVCLGPPAKRVYSFAVVYFSRGTLPQKRNGKRALLGDLDVVVGFRDVALNLGKVLLTNCSYESR